MRKENNTDLRFNSTNGYQSTTNSSYLLAFKGDLLEANLALQYLQFAPNCPFDKNLLVYILVTAEGKNGLPGSG